jgi:hypothetical protein
MTEVVEPEEEDVSLYQLVTYLIPKDSNLIHGIRSDVSLTLKNNFPFSD